MELVHTEVLEGVTYKLYVEQDDSPIRGNAIVSGDDDEDTRVEDELIARLEHGDVWAWANVNVEASINLGGHTFKGDDWLGQCSYRDTADFVQPLTSEDKARNIGSYYEDMKSEARDHMVEAMRDAVKGADEARAWLTALEVANYV